MIQRAYFHTASVKELLKKNYSKNKGGPREHRRMHKNDP